MRKLYCLPMIGFMMHKSMELHFRHAKPNWMSYLKTLSTIEIYIID